MIKMRVCERVRACMCVAGDEAYVHIFCVFAIFVKTDAILRSVT